MPQSRPEVANFAAAEWSSPRVPGWGVRAAAVRVASPSLTPPLGSAQFFTASPPGT